MAALGASSRTLPPSIGSFLAESRSKWIVVKIGGHWRKSWSLRCAADDEGELQSIASFGRESSGLETISAQITPITDNFFSSDVYGDPDKPMEGFSSVSQAIEAVAEGKCVVVMDNQNAGHLVMAGSLMTTESAAFLVKRGSGLLYCPMSPRQLDRLKVPLMVQEQGNEVGSTISVDVKFGTTTGVSAEDRTNTILALASSESKPEHFRRPGHIFPIRCHEGGVLSRPESPEGACDLVALAGLPSVAVSSQVVNEDDLAPVAKLQELASEEGLLMISIQDLVRYMKKREKLVERTAVARLPTKWGVFNAYSYESKLNRIEHVAYVKGDIGDGQNVLVRVHSECITGDILGSLRCSCGRKLAIGMNRIEKAGRGVFVYLKGPEVGVGSKLEAYNRIDNGEDEKACEADKVDSRDYGIGAQILRDIGVRTMELMTDNPAKYLGLRGYGLVVTSRTPVSS